MRIRLFRQFTYWSQGPRVSDRRSPCAVYPVCMIDFWVFRAWASESMDLCMGQTDVSVRPCKHGLFYQRSYWWCAGLCALLTSRTLFHTLLAKNGCVAQQTPAPAKSTVFHVAWCAPAGQLFSGSQKIAYFRTTKQNPAAGGIYEDILYYYIRRIYLLHKAVFSRRNAPT